MINLPITLLIALGIVAAGIGTTVTISYIKKTKAKHNAKVAEAHLRKHAKSSHQDMSNVKKMVKNYYQTKLKCANKKLALGIERGINSSNYKQKEMDKQFFNREILAAKIGLASLKGKSPSEIEQLRKRLEIIDNNYEIPYYAEKLLFDNKLVVELFTNSIVSDSNFMINDYKLALDPVSNSIYYDRKEGNGIYPMVTEIYDTSTNDNKLIMRVSDVSPTRYAEFTLRILAKLYERIENEQHNRQNISYVFNAFDSLKKGRKSTSTVRLNLRIKSKEHLKKLYETEIKPFISSFKGMPRYVSNHTFEQLVDYFSYETKNRQMKQNTLYFNPEAPTAQSLVLINKYNALADKIKYQSKEEYPIMISVQLNNAEIVRASADSNELRHLSIPYLLAYAYVMSYEREKYDLAGAVTIKTARLDAANQQVIYNPNETFIFGDTATIASLGNTYSTFWTTVKEIAAEKKFEIDNVQKPQPTPVIEPRFTRVVETPKLDVRDDFVTTRSNQTKESFYKKVQQSTMDQSYPFVTKIESKNKSGNPNYACNLAMSTYSRAVQAEYFMNLLLEAYVIQHREHKDLGIHSPVSVSVYWQKVLDETTNQRNIESKTRTYETCEQLKKEILLFAKNNFRLQLTEKEFDAKIQAIEDELYPELNAETTTFQF